MHWGCLSAHLTNETAVNLYRSHWVLATTRNYLQWTLQFVQTECRSPYSSWHNVCLSELYLFKTLLKVQFSYFLTPLAVGARVKNLQKCGYHSQICNRKKKGIYCMLLLPVISWDKFSIHVSCWISRRVQSMCLPCDMGTILERWWT